MSNVSITANGAEWGGWDKHFMHLFKPSTLMQNALISTGDPIYT